MSAKGILERFGYEGGEMENTFKIGDYVTHALGSPVMEVAGAGIGFTFCRWFEKRGDTYEDGLLREASFPTESLVKVRKSHYTSEPHKEAEP